MPHYPTCHNLNLTFSYCIRWTVLTSINLLAFIFLFVNRVGQKWTGAILDKCENYEYLGDKNKAAVFY